MRKIKMGTWNFDRIKILGFLGFIAIPLCYFTLREIITLIFRNYFAIIRICMDIESVKPFKCILI